MKLSTLLAGGEGSGPNAPCPQCGPKGEGKSKEEAIKEFRDKYNKPNFKTMTDAQKVQYLKDHTITGPNVVPKSTGPKSAKSEKSNVPLSGKPYTPTKSPTSGTTVKGPKGGPTPTRGKDVAVYLPKHLVKNLEAPLQSTDKKTLVPPKSEPSGEDMRKWKEGQPEYKGWKMETKIEEGATAALRFKKEAWNTETWDKVKYPEGTRVLVNHILPQVGSNPPMALVKYPHGDIEHVPITDLTLVKNPKASIDVADVPKRNIAQQTKTSEGATYTQLKAPKEGRPLGSRNVWKEGQPNPDPHPLKGGFVPMESRGKQVVDIKTFDLKTMKPGGDYASVYVAQRTPKTPKEVMTGTHGTTVILTRDPVGKSAKVVEVNVDHYGNTKGIPKTTKFTNMGHLQSYTDRRYGFTFKLKTMRRKS